MRRDGLSLSRDHCGPRDAAACPCPGYGPHWNQWIDVAKEPDRYMLALAARAARERARSLPHGPPAPCSVRPAFGKTDVETEAERDRRELEQNFRDALVGQGWAVHDMERDGLVCSRVCQCAPVRASARQFAAVRALVRWRVCTCAVVCASVHQCARVRLCAS